MKMTNFQSKHVALLKNKKDCAGVYCVTLIELQAHRDAFIQKKVAEDILYRMERRQVLRAAGVSVTFFKPVNQNDAWLC